MSQYRTGTVDVTNADATVTGNGTAFLSEVAAGDLFTVLGSNVVYEVASITNDAELELTSTYAGANASNQEYAISRDFTSELSIPYPERGDVDTAGILRRAFTKVDTLLAEMASLADGISILGTAFGSAANIKAATEELTGVSGASVSTTNLVPAGATLIGVVTRITGDLGTSNGTTGYNVGDGTDADRFGAITGTTEGTTSDHGDFTADPRQWSASAQDVTLTAVGGNFDATGDIRVTAYYIDFTAPTS